MLSVIKYYIFSGLFFLNALAQDTKHDVDIDVNVKNSPQWYSQWWIWVIAGAFFVIIVVALSRGGGKKD